MPTVNPRVNVTLSPTLDSLVSRLAVLSRVSKSNVLRELLETAAPALSRAVAVMEAAERAKPDVMRGLARSLERSQIAAEVALEHALGTVVNAEDLVAHAEAVKGRRPARTQRQGASPGGAAGAASTPVPVTRGSGPPKSRQGIAKATQQRKGKEAPIKVGKGVGNA